MTRDPTLPNGALDGEERALAAILPRPHGRTEPGADLDARILAAAQSALQRPPALQPAPRRSWIAPLAVAASLVLAVGLAWQLRPPTAAVVQAPASGADAADASAMHVRSNEASPAAPPLQARIETPQPIAAMTSPEAAAPADAAPRAEVAAGNVADAAMAPPPPPAPPPAVTAEEIAAAQVAVPQPAELPRAAAPAMAKAQASEAVRERASAAGGAPARAQDEVQRAADAGELDVAPIADQGEDVPPATADSPAVREAWLRRIGELLEQGKTEDAKASLDEFKRRYPDAALPPELRRLER
jgi:hypothetical protein